jgi:acyl-CoA thioesterase II
MASSTPRIRSGGISRSCQESPPAFGALFGGCALGAAVAVLETVTARPLVWATVQYLEFARPPSVVDLAVNEVVRGRSTTQARVLATVDGKEIFTVLAALGRRQLPWTGEWAVRPEVTAPEDSPLRPLTPDHAGTISDHLEMRVAQFADTASRGGRAALWVRLPESVPATAASLAIVGDFVIYAISELLGQPIFGTSIDNTLRMVCGHPTRWVLVDIQVQAVVGGFGHGHEQLWAEDGTLLATASQSAIVREHRERET